MLALHIGSYCKVHGDHEIEKFEAFMNIEELNEEAKEIFVLGIEAFLIVVRQIEMSGAKRH